MLLTLLRGRDARHWSSAETSLRLRAFVIGLRRFWSLPLLSGTMDFAVVAMGGLLNVSPGLQTGPGLTLKNHSATPR